MTNNSNAFGFRLLVTGLLVGSLAAQSTFDTASCVPGSGVTTFANCNYFFSEVAVCSSSAGASLSCWCKQSFFDAIIGLVPSDIDIYLSACRLTSPPDARARSNFVWGTAKSTKTFRRASRSGTASATRTSPSRPPRPRYPASA